MAFHDPVLWSNHSTSGSPNSSSRCGIALSVTLANAIGYHCFTQLKSVNPGSCWPSGSVRGEIGVMGSALADTARPARGRPIPAEGKGCLRCTMEPTGPGTMKPVQGARTHAKASACVSGMPFPLSDIWRHKNKYIKLSAPWQMNFKKQS